MLTEEGDLAVESREMKQHLSAVHEKVVRCELHRPLLDNFESACPGARLSSSRS